MTGTISTKSFYVNNLSTMTVQVHGYANRMHIGIQNSNYDFSIFNFTSNPLMNTWRYDFSDPNYNFYLSFNSQHGIKGTPSPNERDFFLGFYGDPFMPTNTNGYGFIRFSALNGAVDQAFWYDLALIDFAPIVGFYDDGIEQTSYVSSGKMTTTLTPYFYYGKRNFFSDVPDCSNLIDFTQNTHTLNIDNETVSKLSDPNSYSPNNLNVSATAVAKSVTQLCSDDLRMQLREEFENTLESVIVKLSSNQITLQSKKAIAGVELFTIDGKLIERINVLNALSITKSINTNIPTGVYIIRIKLEDKFIYRKVFYGL
jgi:hypothetical protein